MRSIFSAWELSGDPSKSAETTVASSCAQKALRRKFRNFQKSSITRSFPTWIECGPTRRIVPRWRDLRYICIRGFSIIEMFGIKALNVLANVCHAKGKADFLLKMDCTHRSARHSGQNFRSSKLFCPLDKVFISNTVIIRSSDSDSLRMRL